MNASWADLLQRVHEPEVLAVVGAFQLGLLGQEIVAVVQEALGGEGVVRHVVVAVADPLEAEAEHRPARVEQEENQHRVERQQLAERKRRPAPDERGEAGNGQRDGDRRPDAMDGLAPLAEAIDDQNGNAHAHRRGQEPAPQHAKADLQAAEHGLAQQREKGEETDDQKKR
jgi:hypothetical protein